MRVIAHCPSNNTSYVIDPKTRHIEWAGSHEACKAYLEYITFHNFYYSVKGSHGRTLIPNPTKHYWDVFTSVKGTHIANYFVQVPMSKASGWTYQLT